ncbi:hypothetical protein B0H17DRAFT_9700 [Mycena rosella]|uniref:Zn(2)-C6 fungal-type domain-containing protein n=1 Tax=Mycena rosella TaxID=1033263 RepID=A0AAD7GSJ7_MYCRO|nr:hypothetical protein B0H17DRAFT_9700 [Mycena rosella]
MKRASTSENPGPKRAKASQACASCRRHKSRCEILDVRTQPGAQITIRCHRCKILGVECSFEASNLIHFFPNTRQTESPATASEESSPPEIYGGLNTLAAAASSRPNAETGPSLPGRYDMLPEDLVPTASTPIWGSVSRVDWTATPMLAIQELVRCPRTDAGLVLPDVGRLEDILSPLEITSLLEIFETRYSPWLCAQPESVEYTNSQLDIVRCTIASRHLGPGARSEIAPRLQKLTEDVFVREIFNPQPSIESITALLILSVWAPICGGAEARDGRLLIASAVSMARNLHLQNESKRATGLRAEKDRLSSHKQAELDESTQRWRLWMHLSISESMLCIGTGRAPVSQISQLDHDMTSLATLPDFTLSAIRDIRLGLSAKMFQTTETAFKTRLKSAQDLSSFFKTINNLSSTMEGLGRLLSPLPVVTQHDTFYSQMLILQYHSCRLLMMHHALRETRTVHERDTPLIPWWKVQTAENQCVPLHFGRIALVSAEAVLTAFLAPSDLTLLSTAPDNIYIMVGFAATWIFVSNFSIYQLGGGKVGGASERLQILTIDRLNQIAHAPDHSAGRCGHVLNALLSAWERRKLQGMRMPDGTCQPHSENTHSCHYAADMPYEHRASGSTHEDGAMESAMINPNADLFTDDAFWTSFVQNLTSDTFIAQDLM